MTQNQIKYWELQELKRSNLAKEDETKRSNLAKEHETHRANVASESVAIGTLSETQRSHLQSEILKGKELEEIARHNTAVEGETIRSNIAKEGETQRHNTVTEALEGRKITETERSNLVNEQLKAETVSETIRSNVVNENLKRAQNAEAHRSNVQNELAKTRQREIDIMKLDQDLLINSNKVSQGWVSTAMSAIPIFNNLGGKLGTGGYTSLTYAP